MKKDRQEQMNKLELWKGRLRHHDTAFENKVALMDKREEIYRGDKTIRALVADDKTTETTHVRNIASEIIESQVNSNIPQPKVTPLYKKHEALAAKIENLIRNKLDQLPMEVINDMMERTVPIQGGALLLLDWDNNIRTHTTVGDLVVRMLHPKKFVPQEGVFSSVEDMDFIIIKLDQTKKYIERRYGVKIIDGEAEPEIRSVDDTSPAEDMVTQYVGYYRNEDGGIGKFSWVNDTVLEDLEDYQARRLKRCVKCGALEPADDVAPTEPTPDGTWPGDTKNTDTTLLGDAPKPERPKVNRANKKACKYCGGTAFEESQEDVETLLEPLMLTGRGPDGKESMTVPVNTEIPYYKPNLYPVVVQNNVSVYGQLLGESDVDKIADQQNTTNRLSAKIISKVCEGGSYISLPVDATIDKTSEEMKVIRLTSPADKDMIDVFNMEADVSTDMILRDSIYEEARQIIGITDSFQGRKDETANSGKAKQIAAAQSAGRLESKRTMKNAAYARLFEAMFKFELAYADEPRPIVFEDMRGETQYEEFNRYDFLERDKSGEYYWNDLFLFSCDTTAPLASNREAMWQETRMNLESGAFGDRTQLPTLILFWTKMDELHYPGAKKTKAMLEEEFQRQNEVLQLTQQVQEQEALLQQQNDMLTKMPPPGQSAPPAGVPQDRRAMIEAQAQADAERAAMGGQGQTP